jgi:energy-coupling factor transporter ATP-binding protein EcfA2
VIFADEPTGELDSATGDEVFEALRSANRDLGTAVLIVTHDSTVSSQVQRTVAIRDGRTSSEVVRRTRVTAEGLTEVIAEEYAVLDRSGRMQIPKEYRKALDLKDRVRLELEPDHMGVWADGTPHLPKARPTPGPAAAGQAPETPEIRPAPDGASQPAPSPRKARRASSAPPPEPPPAPPPADPSVPYEPPSSAAADLTPQVHFQDAPARPTPEEQAAAGHPLAGRPVPPEATSSDPYTPRVLPYTPPQPPVADEERGADT